MKTDVTFGEFIDADVGCFNVTQEERDRLRQKVSTLRNIALTAPYSHRGDVVTLNEAVKLMLKYQVGITLLQKDIDNIGQDPAMAGTLIKRSFVALPVYWS